MKKKLKIAFIVVAICIFIAISLACTAIILLVGNPMNLIRNKQLDHAINSIATMEETTVQINDVIPFEWDAFYAPPPYESKENIEKEMGIKSHAIRSNIFNEGMVHLIFVNDGKVVSSILRYPKDIGFCMDLTANEDWKITFEENAQFRISTQADGVLVLTYEKEAQ